MPSACTCTSEARRLLTKNTIIREPTLPVAALQPGASGTFGKLKISKRLIVQSVCCRINELS